MTVGGQNTGTQDESIQQILSEFDGNLEAAIEAMREYKKSHADTPLIQAPALDTPVVLSVQNLVKVYKLGKQHITVLDSVSFDIHKGELIAITGASGSGKSTLLQLLGGLDKPTSGEVLIEGTSLAKLSDGNLSKFRRQTIGFVFQFFYLQPFLKLRRNLEVTGMFARTKRPERLERVTELANKVGLGDRLNHYPKELSGGQMQRAAIARALLNNPSILLADEPTGNLDSKNGTQIIELFESIRKEFGTTVVIVTHDPAIARRADRTISLADGRLV